MGAMEKLMLYLLPPLGLIIWMWMMLTRVRKFKLPKLKLISVSFRSAFLAVLYAGILVTLLGLLTPGDIRHIDRFQSYLGCEADRLKREADIPAIREWMVIYHNSSDASAKTGEEDEFEWIDRDKLPECISVLRPLYVTSEAKKKHLHLAYGERIIGYWCLTIAPKGAQPHGCGGDVKILEDGAWIRSGFPEISMSKPLSNR